MSNGENPIKEVIRYILQRLTKLENLTNILASAMADVTVVMLDGITGCIRQGCSAHATVEHISDHRTYCDYHAADDVVKNKSKPEDWQDLSHARQLRSLTTYREVLESVEETSPKVRH